MNNVCLTVFTITLLLSSKLWADVGDVYYCTTDKFAVYESGSNSLQQDNTNRKFKFKWEKDRVTFGDGFIYKGSLYPDTNTGNSFTGSSFQASWRQIFAYFDGSKLTFLLLPYQAPSRMVFASCDKF